MKRIEMKVLGWVIGMMTVLASHAQTYQSRTVSTFAGTGLCTALDPVGDLYFTGYTSGSGYQIRELVAVNGAIPTGATPVVFTATNISVPLCLAMNKGGDLFVLENSYGVVLKEILAVNGKIPSNPNATTLYAPQSPSQLQSGLAVDGNGSVFFEEYAGNSNPEYLEEMVAVGGAVTPTSPVVKLYTEPLQGGLSSQAFIQALATDSKNNLYYIHEGSAIYEIPATGSGVNAGTAPQKLASISSSTSSAFPSFGLDASGDLFYATVDQSVSPSVTTVYEEVAVGGTLPATPVVRSAYSDLFTNFQPQGLTSDAAGDIFITAGPGQVVELSTGPPAALSISPVTQTFASTAVGSTSSVLTSTLTNTTAAPIYLSSGSLTDASDFTQTDNCSGIIAATTGSCTVSFTFTPKSAAALSSTYAIHDLNNPGSPLTVVLSGTGTAALVPQVVLSPGSLTFTTVAGTAAANQSLTLSNPGTGALAISTVVLSGTNAASFSVVTNGCTGTLGTGASCTIVVGCSATTYGSYAATLTVTDNATPATQTSSLACNVSGTAQATLTPPSLSFGSVPVGSTTAAQTVTLSNPGTAPLTMNSVALTGTNASNFAIATNTCGATLAVGAACSVGVTFTPTAASSASAALTVVDSVGTQTSALSGTGSTATAADFTMSVAGTQPIAFGFYTGSIDLTLHLASLSTSTPFNNAVSLSATGLPAGTTYTFTPASATPGAAGANVDVLIQLPDSVRANLGNGPAPWRNSPEVVTLAGLVLIVLWRKRRVGIPSLLAVVLLSVCAMTAVTGCDEGFAEYYLPGDKGTVTITGTSGTTMHTVAVQVVTTH